MYTNKKIPLYKRPLVVLAALLLVAAGMVAALEFTNTTHIFHKQTTISSPVSASQSTKGETATKSTTTPITSKPETTNTTTNVASGTVGSSQSDTTKNNAAPSTNLIDPTGTFVVNHTVTVSNEDSSVCNTTVGATCQIVFTSGSLTEYLATETTDSGGSAYWPSWMPKSIGLTPGTWQVQAVATLGGQTKTSTDATNLVIKP
jgi:hypothetical protein